MEVLLAMRTPPRTSCTDLIYHLTIMFKTLVKRPQLPKPKAEQKSDCFNCYIFQDEKQGRKGCNMVLRCNGSQQDLGIKVRTGRRPCLGEVRCSPLAHSNPQDPWEDQRGLTAEHLDVPGTLLGLSARVGLPQLWEEPG